MLWTEISGAAQRVARRPLASTSIAVVFAVGICANAIVFALAHAWLVRSLPFPNESSLVVVDSTIGATRGNLTGREIRDIGRDSRLVEEIAGYYPSQYNLTGGAIPEALTCIITTHNLFRILGVTMVSGEAWSGISDWREQYLVALSHDVWSRRYGADPSMPGRSVILDGAPYTVTGVLPRGFAFPGRVDMFRAVTGFNAESVRRFSAVARLRAGVSVSDTQAELDDLARQYERSYPDTNRAVRFHVRSLRDSYVGAVRPYILLLGGAVALVLLISAANVATLGLVRALGRRHEVAIRTALGAERWRIVCGFVIEHALLALVGGVIGIAGAAATPAMLKRTVALALPPWMDVRIDAPVVLFAMGLSLVIGLGTGVVTGMAALDRHSVVGLRTGSRGSTGSRRDRRIRMALVAGQVALAVAVLTGAGLTTKSLGRLGAVDLGLRPDHLVTFRVDPPWKKYPEQKDMALFYERALDRLATLPGVAGVGASLYLPLSGLRDITQTVSIEGQSPADAAVPFVNVHYVSPTYFSVMGMAQQSGRSFISADREGGQRVALVSRAAAARFWPGKDPLGQRLRLTIRTRGFGQDNSAEVNVAVVGVIGDVRGVDPIRPPDLDVYLPIAQAYAGDAFFVLRSTTTESVAALVAAAIRDVDPEQSIFDIALMDDRVAARIWQHRTATTVLLTFAVVTVILVTVGIYALVSFTVAAQRREIGVRVALGAQRRDVRQLVVFQAMVPVTVGLALGVPFALAGSQGLRAVLYLVSPADPSVVFGVIGLLVVLSLGACILPTRRASRIDPVIVFSQ